MEQTPSAPQEHTSSGPVTGIVIVIALLVIAGFLYVVNKLQSPASTENQTGSTTDSTYFPQATTSDDISAIEADLNASDLENLDKELTDLEKEIGN